jgi:hypothetical protein
MASQRLAEACSIFAKVHYTMYTAGVWLLECELDAGISHGIVTDQREDGNDEGDFSVQACIFS